MKNTLSLIAFVLMAVPAFGEEASNLKLDCKLKWGGGPFNSMLLEFPVAKDEAGQPFDHTVKESGVVKIQAAMNKAAKVDNVERHTFQTEFKAEARSRIFMFQIGREITESDIAMDVAESDRGISVFVDYSSDGPSFRSIYLCKRQ